VFADERCVVPHGLWRNECDGRGYIFINAFVNEIHRAIEDVVANVKQIV
jgi:hypothetical protein